MSELKSIVIDDSPAFVKLKDKHKQELVEDGRLNKAADLAARREILLKSREPDAWKVPHLKVVGRELRQWVKRVRQPFGNLESPNVNAASEDDGASPISHMMAQLVKQNATSGQTIKTRPNRNVPKRSRIPTPVITPSTRKAKKRRKLPGTPLTLGFEALPDDFPLSREEPLDQAKRVTDKASRTPSRKRKQETKKASKQL